VGEGGIGKQSNMERGRGLRERTGECYEADTVLSDWTNNIQDSKCK